VADDAGGDLSVPSTDNWSEWTFEQALKALTGEGADLHTPAKASWFTFDPNPSGSDNITYHAFDTYWYGVNIDQQAITTWTKAIDVIDEMMADVSRGRRGSMDQQSLLDFAQAIRTFATFNHDTADIVNSWASRLDSDDSSFRGKAAFLIQWRLKTNGDGLTDTYEQVTTRHGKNIADVVNDAAVELGSFNKTMSDAWQLAMTNMRNWLTNLETDAINAVAKYIDDSGLDQQHSKSYILGAFNSDTESGKAFVRKTLQAYPKGDLTTAAGWQSISNSITKDLLTFIDLFLDQSARFAITKLAPKYVLATSSLIELTAPPTETPPQPDPDTDGNGDGDLPPPDGSGSGDVPPPPDGGGSGDVPPPPDGGGSGDVPPPPDGGGSGDVPLAPDGGGSGDVPPPDGGIGDIGLGDGGLNGPPGTGGDVPADGGIGPFVPGLVPPGGGTGIGDDRANGGTGIGPGSDGAFDEPGGENGLLTPPGGGADNPKSLLPPGAGDSRTAIPPGSGLGHSGFGTDPGEGFGSGGPGVGLGGGGGGFGSGTGSGGLNGLNGLPTQLSGGFPGANGAPGTSGGGGGVPFFPPMMGGAGQGGAGEKPKERERQTWLSEDEEIWGTRVAVGSGVVGRPDDEEFELEQVPLTGPSRRTRRSEIPRRPRPAEEAAREATTAGDEASGSA
jgi:hypothetical protein